MTSGIDELTPEQRREYARIGLAREDAKRAAVTTIPPHPARPVFNPDNIPAELKRLRRWVCWRYTWNAAKEKWDKPPLTTGGYNASTADPDTWSTFQACLEAYRNAANDFDGIGIVCGLDESGVIVSGTDIDHHIDERGQLSDLSREIIAHENTYAERSPSKHGIRLIHFGKLPAGRRKDDKRGIEMYDYGRFLTITGDHIDGTPSTVESREGELAAIHARLFEKPIETPTPTITTKPIAIDDHDLIELARHSNPNFDRLWRGDLSAYIGKDGKPDHSAADDAACCHLAFWTGKDAARIDRIFRSSPLMRPKWDEVHRPADGATYGAMTIEKAITLTREVYDPDRRNGNHPTAIDEVMSDDTPAVPMSEDTPPVDEAIIAAGETSAKKKRSKTPPPTDDELAQRWLNVHPMTAYGLGDWRRYDAGAWRIVSQDAINREIRDILIGAKREGVRPSRYVLSSVAEFARLTVSIPNEQWDADHNILVCHNGALRIPTRELLPHDPTHYVTESLPYDFDPNADAPTWHYVLDSTIPEAADFVQEFAGLCLTPDTSLEIALWFIGVPGGGRSTIIGGHEAMLGNRAGLLGLAAIERSQFALTNLPGKTLVTATEQPNLYIRSAHILNAIISGEPIIIERKYEHPYQITPHAKILWAMNDLPRISEANSGLFRRVKIIHFPPRDEAQQDPTIKDRVRQEAAGILNWALIGLDRLRQRGRFDVPQCVQAATADFRESNDIPAMFVSEMCLRGSDYQAQGKTLYDAYKQWCIDTGHKPQSSTSLAEDWRRLGFERVRTVGKSYWHGVGVIEQKSKPQQQSL